MDEKYLIPIMAKEKNKTARVWRAIKDVDDDSNGFLSVEELEGCFKENLSVELDGKSLVYFFRRFSTDHDRELINYRLVKSMLMEGIREHMELSPIRLTPNLLQKSGTLKNIKMMDESTIRKSLF